MSEPYNTLFLCTGNSARSVLAEALLAHLGRGRFRAFSAGSHPTGRVNAFAIETLEGAGIPLPPGLQSKSWDLFAAPGAPAMDFIITVCDSAAGELCPVWPGRPATAHWSFPDPAAATGSPAERRAFFFQVFGRIRRCVERMVSLPLESRDPLELRRSISEISRSSSAESGPGDAQHP